ncbi:MAG: DUF935 domain-containing protein [Calditrichia bacterium]
MGIIWVSDKQYISFADSKSQSLTRQIASRERSIDFYGIGMYLPDPDPVLRARGQDITVYKQIIADDQVWTCHQRRKAGTLSREWEIDRGKAKSKITNIIADLFTNLDIYRIISEILDAVSWGFKPLEVIWEKVGPYWLPADVIGKPVEWFHFDQDNRLKFKSKNNYIQGEEIPPFKFLCPTHHADYANPYGQRLLSKCFWPVTFKKGGLKFWLYFTEKYGMPHLVLRHPRNATENDIQNLLDMGEKMIQDAVAVLPDDSRAEFLKDESRAASADIYDRLVSRMETSISKVYLGHGAAADATPGKLGEEKNALTATQDLIDADIKLVENTFNKLIAWINQLNFNFPVNPKFVLYQKEEVDKTLAERDEILSRTGVSFSKKYFIKNYGLAEEDFNISPQTTPRQPVAFQQYFSEPFPDQQLLDQTLQKLPPNQLQQFMDAALQGVFRLINNQSSYEQILEKLATLYPQMDDNQLIQHLARAMFLAETWGQLSENEIP